jgi:hypothetical protein
LEELKGDEVKEILAAIDRIKPDLLLAGITRGVDAESVSAAAFEIIRRSAVPSLLAFGSAV